LEDLVRKGQRHKRKLPEFKTTETRERQRVKQFAIGLHESSRETAALVAGMLDLEGVGDLLDLGGGAGSYSMAFAQAKPELKVTLFELPIPAGVARKFVREAGLEDRIRIRRGDFLRDDLGRERYDAVFMSNVIHLLCPDDNRKLIRKAYRSLRAGGKIVVKDMMANAERDGPFYSLYFALTMLMFTDDGDTYAFSDVKQWMGEAGFERIRRRTVIPHESYMLIGNKK
jgi:predicted O-methyltransferase YrrM